MPLNDNGEYFDPYHDTLIINPPKKGPHEGILQPPEPIPIIPPDQSDPVIPNPYLPGGPGGGKLLPILDPVSPNDPTIEERVQAMKQYDGSRTGVVAIPPSNSKYNENSHTKYYAKETQPPTIEDYLKKYANIITIAVGVLALVTFLKK